MKEPEDYTFLYNLQNVLTSLAVDIEFMKNISAKINVKLLNFLALALLSWGNTLKVIKVQLELLTAVDMMHDYEDTIRRCIISAISKLVKKIINACMMKQKKIQIFNILILTTNMDVLCRNQIWIY